jgi:hypothetical protein
MATPGRLASGLAWKSSMTIVQTMSGEMPRGVQVGVVDEGAGDAGILRIETPYCRFYRLIA